jgi:hypothetical protein
MTRMIAAALAAFNLLFLGTGMLAQTRGGTGGTPGFTGTWALASAEGGAAGGGGGGRGPGPAGLGSEITINQDTGTFVVTNPSARGTTVMSFKLDGSESRNVITGRGGQVEQVSKAMKQGDSSIAVTTRLDTPAGQIEQKRVFSLQGDTLVIETTQPGGAGTTKLVYRKK